MLETQKEVVTSMLRVKQLIELSRHYNSRCDDAILSIANGTITCYRR